MFLIQFKDRRVFIMELNKNFNVRNERNLTMLVDFYELTMGNGYLEMV